MDIKVKRDQTNRALSSLLELVVKLSDDSSDVIVRDAMVQRFEYTTEAFWKYLKHYLQTEHNLLANSPREVMRMGLQAKLYDEETSKEFLQMLDDRNLTSHTYIEELATSIATRIPNYAHRIKSVLENL
ncbi:MAG: HI0074 family nucleotidyltransferase substrate-binding subunit [Verrucomicrobia bacterium]|jgi:nucleotidyltransferase substrate binding protein (TIGR01987 family)|nr:HI0074 family nucleotidyltransferase substrate-binding subunit [Verrucomicrobiota bacterium]MDA1048213.1 HI0074 family nucleotidyltransferase substrate-binding subunit [Verrucomicrobiota bacterium]